MVFKTCLTYSLQRPVLSLSGLLDAVSMGLVGLVVCGMILGLGHG